MGAAAAKKLNGDNSIVFTLHGDGELQEGQIWEAAMYASAKKVDNLIAAVDVNEKQIDGSTDEVLAMGSLRAKFEAFGWDVIDVAQGNDLDAIDAAITEAKGKLGRKACVFVTQNRNG